MKKALFLFALFFSFSIQAQVSESCDCIVDTSGYSNFIQTLNPNENAPFQFHVNGTFAVAYGVIDGNTPSVVQDLIDNHPGVTTIVMHSCPGSDDDNANLQASMMIYNEGYKMYLPDEGWIASGAVDMFLAGSIRVVDATFDPVGVHSWSDGTNEATDFPVGHANHLPYINYYVSVGLTQQEAEDFYYFTINAAPANGIHWMTEAEMDQYRIRTCRYNSNPTYSVSQTGNVLSADLSGASYQWIDCSTNTAISGSEAQSFTAPANGTYAVYITENNCADTSACYVVNGVGIDYSGSFEGLRLFPNPVSDGTFHLDLGKEYDSVDIAIMDIHGRRLQSHQLKHLRSVSLDLGNPPGVYWLHISSGSYKTSLPFVKM